MATWATTKTVTFHYTLKALTFRDTLNIYDITAFKQLSKVYVLTGLVLFGITDPEFPDMIKTFGVSLTEMTGKGLIDTFRFFGCKPNLDRIVSFFGL